VLAPDVAVGVDLDVERDGEGVDDGDTDAVQAAGDRVGVAVELPARVQHGHDDLDGRLLLHRVHADRDPAAVVGDPHAAVVLQDHLDARGVARHRLVDRVVHDLPDEVVQTPLTGGADVHAGPLADGLEPLQDRDRRRAVAVLLLRHGPLSLLVRSGPPRGARTGRSTGRHQGARNHPPILPVQSDRNGVGTRLARSQNADPGTDRVATPETGVRTGSGHVTTP
jgi:hypothetical protein